MLKKSVKGGICHIIHRYATINKKYTTNHNKDKKSSYLMY